MFKIALLFIAAISMGGAIAAENTNQPPNQPPTQPRPPGPAPGTQPGGPDYHVWCSELGRGGCGWRRSCTWDRVGHVCQGGRIYY
jgi:hypothetical protein